MTTRYFKATDTIRTFFRASPSQTYASLSVDASKSHDWGWTMHRDGRGRFPAVEITGREYRALIQLKQARTKGNAPRQSWVFNEAIHEAEVLARLTAQSMLSREGRIAANGGYDPLGDMPEGV